MKTSRQENIIYAVLWLVLFITPVMSLYIRTVSNSAIPFDWAEVMMVWRSFAVFLLLFLIHNFLLAPMILGGRRRIAYFSVVVALLALFVTYQCSNNHFHRRGMMDERRGMMDERRGMMDERRGMMDERRGMMEERRGMMEERRGMMDERRGMMDERQGMMDDDRQGMRAKVNRHPKGHPPFMIGERDIVAVMIVILMFAANLGCKFYFKNREEYSRLAELEKKNLEQQLEYLRYQINPHFFMNTLNNIHALVDIDPEKAKDTIVELSRMMRFVLYEGNKQWVSLGREMDFIRHYIALMRLRYTDKVRIDVCLPEETPDLLLPPLMLITFIENAFKHGISYQRDSYVEISVSVESSRLLFICKNSKTDKAHEEKGGVGLENAKQRLNLLYGDNYTLSIADDITSYIVELNIPLRPTPTFSVREGDDG